MTTDDIQYGAGGDNKLCATGMWLTCRPFPSAELLPGSRDHPTICWEKSAVECQPKKLAEAAAAAASDDAAGAAAAKEEEEQDPLQEHMLNLQTQYYEDWKCFIEVPCQRRQRAASTSYAWPAK